MEEIEIGKLNSVDVDRTYLEGRGINMINVAKGKLTLRRKIEDFFLGRRTVVFKDENKWIVCDYLKSGFLGSLDKDSVNDRLMFMIHVHKLGVLLGKEE